MKFRWNDPHEMGVSDKLILQNEPQYHIGLVQSVQARVLLEIMEWAESQVEAKPEKEPPAERTPAPAPSKPKTK